jgi:NADH-quinone oxidoreductase subunit M
MHQFPLLSLITFLPAIGALILLLCVKRDEENAAAARTSQVITLIFTVGTFLLSLLLLQGFDSTKAGFQFEEKHSWMEGYNIGYHMGVDGISLFFILLTTFLMPLCVLASWKGITTQVRNYLAAFLMLETLVIGVFCALDFMLFYFFFEGSLIPMYLIIGIWGGEKRVYAAYKFFLYTLLGSVLLLLALLFIYYQFGTTDIPELMEKMPKSIPLNVQQVLWLAFFASFAVKIPMWPVHTWLPDAHVQAPTAGSVMLAGILLKLGGYGFLRFSLPLLPDASHYFAPLMYWLSVIAVVYTSLIALMQTDMKKLIAYSSIAHMAFVTIGLFTFNQQGIEGSIYQMLSHGLVSAALFMCVGVLYDRMHTKEIVKYGGVVTLMPRFGMLFLLFTMASIGLPSTSGFIGEFLVLTGAFQADTWVAAFATTGVVLGAAYMLWLYKRVCFGEVKEGIEGHMHDLEWQEYAMFVPVAVLVLLYGIYPDYVLAPIHASVEHLIQQANNVLAR